MRGQSARIETVRGSAKSECWRFPNLSKAVRNFFRQRKLPAARRLAGFDSPTLRAATRCRRSHRAHHGVPSTWFQTAQRFARGQIRRAVRTSTKYSGCGQMPARRRANQGSCSPARKPVLPMLLTTVVSPFSAYKRRDNDCHHLNNTVSPGGRVAEGLGFLQNQLFLKLPPLACGSTITPILLGAYTVVPAHLGTRGSGASETQSSGIRSFRKICRTSPHLTAIRQTCRRFPA